MKRGYMVHASKGAEQLDLILQVSRKGMRIMRIKGLKKELMHEFDNPSVKIVQALGKSGSFFNVDQKPAWWVEVYDSDGSKWPMRCRNLGDAIAIEKWAVKRGAGRAE